MLLKSFCESFCGVTFHADYLAIFSCFLAFVFLGLSCAPLDFSMPTAISLVLKNEDMGMASAAQKQKTTSKQNASIPDMAIPVRSACRGLIFFVLSNEKKFGRPNWNMPQVPSRD